MLLVQSPYNFHYVDYECPFSKSRSMENVHEFIRWAKNTDTVRRIGLKWKFRARKISLRRFMLCLFNIIVLKYSNFCIFKILGLMGP